jgi:hypothetical protein
MPPYLNGQNSSQLRNAYEAAASLFHRISGSGASSRHSVGTCTELTRSPNMDERHKQARLLYSDGRHEKAHDRQMLREAVSCRLQTYFITLRAAFPADINALLQRVVCIPRLMQNTRPIRYLLPAVGETKEMLLQVGLRSVCC